jgi:hypothetical protein
MNPTTRSTTIIVSLVSLLAGLAPAGENLVRLIPEGQTIRVDIDGRHFTTYYFNDGMGKPYVRPMLFPVNASDGVGVTADQMTGGGDHPHHRSLYVAQGDVNGADHWAIKGANSPKQRHVSIQAAGDTIVQDLEWEGRDNSPILREKRTLRFFAYPDGGRGIDMTLVFTPIDGPVTFGDTKEGGLCSVRLHKEISANPILLNSTGATGEKETWGKPARWCAESGSIGGKPYSVAILDHPSNPRHPTPWHVRRYGLMTANPFGLHDFDRSKPRGAGNFTMTRDQSTTFKYRVIIQTRQAAVENLDEKWAQFAK